MKPAKIAVLGIAIVAGGAAAYLASSPREAPAPEPLVQQVNTADVLVLSQDIPMGRALSPNDVRWQAWPSDLVPANVITRRDAPNGVEQVVGSLTRVNLVGGEPLRREKLIRADGSGFMAAMLPAGKRAVAINIDTRGASSAGGFVLPNDFVDIIRTYRDEDASKAQGIDVFSSETILSGIRILAIGQNIQEKNGEKVVTGETATLELDARQAELITLGQKVGQLSLVLRSLADAGQKDTVKQENTDAGVLVVRYGVPKQAR
jgi:pilus assembly protein CpaB